MRTSRWRRPKCGKSDFEARFGWMENHVECSIGSRWKTGQKYAQAACCETGAITSVGRWIWESFAIILAARLFKQREGSAICFHNALALASWIRSIEIGWAYFFICYKLAVFCKRRGWDSNSRYLSVHPISSRTQSTTLPPLQPMSSANQTDRLILYLINT